MKISLLFVLSLTLLLSKGIKAQQDMYYVLSSESNDVYIVDNSGAFLIAGQISNVVGESIGGFNGLTINPLSGIIYAIFFTELNGPGLRYLAVIDFDEGTATPIASLSDKVASLTCDNMGNLYGITGDGGANPNRLYKINLTDAALTQIADLSMVPDDDGEAIAFNSSDGMLYRLAGGEFFYKINLETFEQTLITEQLFDGGLCGHALYFNGPDFISLATYLCTLTPEGNQFDCSPEFMPCAKGILPVNTVGLNEIQNLPLNLIQILDLMGRETSFKPNTPLIYVYDDGSTEKVFSVEY